MTQDVGSAFGVCAEAKFSGRRVFVQVSSQVDYRVVSRDSADIDRVENVEIETPRKIVGIKKAAHVNAEISAAAGNQNFHRLDSRLLTSPPVYSFSSTFPAGQW